MTTNDTLLPCRWENYAGNRGIKAYFKHVNQLLRSGDPTPPANAFITGPRRSGKTSGVQLGLRSIHCLKPTGPDFDPCGGCHYCTRQAARFGAEGESLLYKLDPTTEDSRVGPIHTAVINGPTFTPAGVQEFVGRVQAEWAKHQFAWIDEAYRLPTASVRVLLAEMDRLPICWIATSTIQAREVTKTQRAADCEAMDAFRHRFSVKLTTRSPDHEEFDSYLSWACKRASVDADADAKELLVQRTSRSPGEAANYIRAAAALNGGQLTTDFIEWQVENAA